MNEDSSIQRVPFFDFIPPSALLVSSELSFIHATIDQLYEDAIAKAIPSATNTVKVDGISGNEFIKLIKPYQLVVIAVRSYFKTEIRGVFRRAPLAIFL